MKLKNIRLLKEPYKSFILYRETNPFSAWHYHTEYELVLIIKGRGCKMVGDYIDRFEENDLVLLGDSTPHEWLCDPEYFGEDGQFRGEGVVVQFVYDFLGSEFMEAPENAPLKTMLANSARGIEFFGETKLKIISIMLEMESLPESERLYELFSIFRIIATTNEYRLLASPVFLESIEMSGNKLMQRALHYMLQNFQQNIQIKELLKITSMSNTAFCAAFKQTYRMTFKEYLLNIRIGYACKLLTEGSQNISEIAYNSGFENISNFNRQFKKIKGITPSQFQEKLNATHPKDL